MAPVLAGIMAPVLGIVAPVLGLVTPVAALVLLALVSVAPDSTDSNRWKNEAVCAQTGGRTKRFVLACAAL